MNLKIEDKEILALIDLVDSFQNKIKKKGNSHYVKISTKDISMLNLRLLLSIKEKCIQNSKDIYKLRIKNDALYVIVTVLIITLIGLICR